MKPFGTIYRVRIIDAHLMTYWYADKIGQEYFVFALPYGWSNGDFLRYEIIPVGTHSSKPYARYLDQDDVEIIESFEGEIEEAVTVLIHKKEAVHAADRYAECQLAGDRGARQSTDRQAIGRNR